MKMLTLVRTAVAAAGMFLAMMASATTIDPAFEFDTPTFSANFGDDYNFGISFFANQDLQVDALAYYDDGPSTSSHSVALFRMDGTKIAETVVNVNDTLLGNFRYSAISPILLQAGELYRIIGNSTGDNFTWGVNNFIVNPMLTYMGYSYSAANGTMAEFDVDASTGRNMEEAVWGPSLSVRAVSTEVPEPTSYLLMVMGALMLAVTAQRKKQ